MSDLEILHHDESNVKLSCERSILLELNDRLKFPVPKARFMPNYKAGKWDGYIRLVSANSHTAPKGLLGQIVKFCKESGYTYSISEQVTRPFKTDLLSNFHWEDLGLPSRIDPYDYQRDSVHKALQLKRCIIVSATASGKSLIIYAIARHLAEQGAKVLIVVPTVSLVAQMAGDFHEYANGQWDVEGNLHQVHGGAVKQTDKPITVSTWQSMYNQPSKFLQQFDAVLGDEVHELEANSGQKLLNKSTNAFFRVGFTGSMRDAKMNQLSLTGLFGPPTQVAQTRELQDRGILADLRIYACICKHDDAKRLGSKAKYDEEIEHIMESQPRMELVRSLAENVSGNALVLFSNVKDHGAPMYEHARVRAQGKECEFIYRHTPVRERERIRARAEQTDNLVIFASYGVYQRGINIVNLPNIILAGPTKSKIRIIQSIGRGLRKSESQPICYLYDIVDDLKADRKKDNVLLDHFNERYTIYQREMFEVKTMKIDLSRYRVAA